MGRKYAVCDCRDIAVLSGLNTNTTAQSRREHMIRLRNPYILRFVWAPGAVSSDTEDILPIIYYRSLLQRLARTILKLRNTASKTHMTPRLDVKQREGGKEGVGSAKNPII